MIRKMYAHTGKAHGRDQAKETYDLPGKQCQTSLTDNDETFSVIKDKLWRTTLNY